MTTVIKVENLSKFYRLGLIGGRTLRDDVNRWLARLRGKPDPLLKIGQEDHGNRNGEYIWALRDINLQVEQGEILGIIGRNGAGKSTLLKILSRVTAPTSGQVKIKGRVASLLEVGTGFHPELTGRENVYMNGAILGMTKTEIRRKFDEIVDFAGVEKFIDTPVKRYSSGMYVRLAFAVAAHLEPEILLVDEVLAVGDVAFQKKCLGKMGEVAKGGRTVLFVSHNMPTITTLCQRAILLHNGELTVDDSAAQAVAGYMASIYETVQIEPGFVSLVNHGRRKEHFDQMVSLTYCALVNETGERTGYLTIGETARIMLGYKVNKPVNLDKLIFSIGINDSQDKRVTYLLSNVVKANLDDLHLQGEVCCVIPRLPLVPGRYSLTVGCKVGNGWSDAVVNAIYFDVTGNNFYASRQLPPLGGVIAGSVLIDYDWVVV